MKLLLLSCLIMISLVAGFKGCRNPTEPGDCSLGTGTNISNLGGGSSRPVIAVSPDEDVHVVWTEQLGGDLTTEEIYYAMKSTDGSWSEPVNLSNNQYASRFPSIGVDGVGNIHVAWQDASPDGITWRLFYSVKAPEGGWSLPETLVCGGMSGKPRIAIDREGETHMIWNEYLGQGEVFYSRREPGGSWSEPVNLSESSDWLFCGNKSIDVDPWGSVHVVWEGLEDFTSPSQILYTMKPVGGTWTTSENISRTAGASWNPSIVADIAGDLHVVWNDDTEIVGGFHQFEIYYTTKTEGGGWVSPIDISILRRTSDRPYLTQDLQGNLHLVWYSTKYELRIYYAIKRRGEEWSSPIFVSRPEEGYIYPALAVDSQGRVHIVWQDGHPTGNIFYFEFEP